MHYFSPSTGGAYIQGINAQIPPDSVSITESTFKSLFLTPLPPGKMITSDSDGQPLLAERTRPTVTTESLCLIVDQAADGVWSKLVGNPLRATEYGLAAAEARQFASAGYSGEVPPMVAAWAINGRTAQQAADEILSKAAHCNVVMSHLRAVRLQIKERIRSLMASGDISQSQEIASEATFAIEAALTELTNKD